MLIECKDCRGKVSNLAHHCPHCGRPNSEATKKQWMVVAVMLTIGLGLVAWRLSHQGAF